VTTRVRLLHLAEDGDTSGFFPQLATHHDRASFEMHFATLKPIAPWLARYMEAQGVPWVSLDCARRPAYPLGMLHFARYLRSQRIDVVHTHLFDPSVVGLLTASLRPGLVRLHTRHHSDYHTRINKTWHVRLDQLCTRLSDAVIAVSEHTAEHLREREGAPAHKVHVVRNGIDFARVRVSGPDAVARARLELAPTGTDLLVVPARLHAEKGHTYLFQALPALRQRARRPLTVCLAGSGSAEEGYRAQLQELGCADLVRFLGFRRDLPDLFAAADLVVLPSVAEAFGLAVAEALYLGCAVVATRAGGLPEIVDDGRDGILVPPGDSGALAEAILSLLADPARRRAFGKQGHQKMASGYSFEAMVRGYETITRRLVEAQRAGRR
jgi:glycosyltransferase involved in cell wall biosynthesis